MAKIYNKTTSGGTDKTLILDSREAFLYPFQFTDWSTIRFAFYFHLTTLGDDNSAMINAEEFLTVNNYEDRVYFGLKNNNTSFPTTLGASFIGLMTAPGAIARLDVSSGSATNILQTLSTSGVKPNANVESYGSDTIFLTPEGNADDQTAYACALIMNYTVINKGLSSQQIEMKIQNRAGLSFTNQAQFLNDAGNFNPNATFTNTYSWNSGGLPLQLPNAIFLYSPFINYRLKIFSVGMLDYS